MSHKVEGRCLSNSLTDVPETLRKRGTPAGEIPPTLDYLKQSVDAGRYRRLDKFQEDLFHLLHRAREAATSVDSQLFNDSVDLQALYLKKRDELCKGVLSSPATLYIHSQLVADVDEVRRLRGKKEKAEVKKREAEEGEAVDSADEVRAFEMCLFFKILNFPLPTLLPPHTTKHLLLQAEAKPADKEPTVAEEQQDQPSSSEISLESAEHDSITYHPKDYVYVKDTTKSPPAEPHIMRMETIVREAEDPTNTVLLKGTWCYRPNETFHRASR